MYQCHPWDTKVYWHIWENLYSLKTESTTWWNCGTFFSSDCEGLLLGKTWSGMSPQNKDLHYDGVVMILFLQLPNYQNLILKGVLNFGLKAKAVVKNLFANLRSNPSISCSVLSTHIYIKWDPKGAVHQLRKFPSFSVSLYFVIGKLPRTKRAVLLTLLRKPTFGLSLEI